MSASKSLSWVSQNQSSFQDILEQYEYSYQKPLEDLMNPAPTASVGAGTAATDPPNPNHPEPSLRTLPFSSIKVYKNGDLIGTVRIFQNNLFPVNTARSTGTYSAEAECSLRFLSSEVKEKR